MAEVQKMDSVPPAPTLEDVQERGEAAVHPLPIDDDGGGAEGSASEPPAEKGGDTAVAVAGAEETSSPTPPPQQQLPFWRKKKSKKVLCAAALALGAVAVGLGVGLGVGLSRDGGADGGTVQGDGQGDGQVKEAGVGDLTKPTLYRSTSDDVISYQVNSFSKEVLQPYESCQEFEEDLTQAARHLANILIGHYAKEQDFFMDGGTEAPTGGGADDSSADKRETSYDTNIQVKGVDEADVVKSDGERVFAAYGDTIVAWDARTGRKLSETVLPAIPFDDSGCRDDDWSEPKPQQADDSDPEEASAVNATAESAEDGEKEKRGEQEDDAPTDAEVSVSSNGNSSSNGVGVSEPAPAEMPPRPCWRPKARVQSLLLHENRLVAMVSGYKEYWHLIDPVAASDNEGQQRILSDYGSIQVRIYDTETLTEVNEMKLIGRRDLPGHFRDGRSILSDAYVVTSTYIDTYEHFERKLCRWCWHHYEGAQGSRYQDMDEDEYVRNATEYALGEVIPEFVKRLIAEIEEREGGDCSRITRIAMFQTGDVGGSAVAEHWWDRGMLGGLSQVSSFDMAGDAVLNSQSSEPEVHVETSTAFVPDAYSPVYATADLLFVTGRGYDQHRDPEVGYVESTFYYGYSLPGSGKAALPVSVGKVAGWMLNQFSMDLHEGYLRVATTVPARSRCVAPGNETENGEGKDDGPDGEWAEDAVFCEWKTIRDPANQVTVLKLPGPDDTEPLMKEVGQAAGLGKPGESITAVRFIGDFGFVVTFERTDPFIVLDMKNPLSPKVLYNLEISGFSNYLHPTEDGQILIAVGQDATDTGRQIGLQITLFSVANKNMPEVLDRFTVEESDEQWSSSEVQWEHKAFRYLPESGVVILPAAIHSGRADYFDGFLIFDVNKKNQEYKIEKRFEANLAGGWCDNDGYLQARSMVFDGYVTLMKGHAVKSYDLDYDGGDAEPEPHWELDLDC